MKAIFRRLWKPVLILVPYFIGLTGFLFSGEPLLQSMFNCVCLYTLNYQDPPANLLIEAARWLAPLATASTFVLIITALRRHLQAASARWTGDSVGVWGCGAEKDVVLKQLGSRGIDLEDAPMKAHSYILMGSEADNLEYYQRHSSLLRQRPVYLQCGSLPEQSSTDPHLQLFCPEETAARIFWKENFLYALSAAHDHQLKIVILGFDKLGREVLLSALHNNIFHPDQRIEYHIFGNPGSFQAVHCQLDQISDPVLFHEENWYDSMNLLKQAHMILVLQQQDQLQLLQDLTQVFFQKPIHVFSAEPHGAAVLAAQSQLHCFDWKREALTLENIRDPQRYLYSKRINLRYAHLYMGVAENKDTLEEEWCKAGTFSRYSCIRAADYHAVQKQIMQQRQQTMPLSDELVEYLSELEHIRWCRYHYLNNWRYGIPANGKSKDAAQRIHTCLMDYAALSDAEKQKDRDNVLLLFDLDQKEL